MIDWSCWHLPSFHLHIEGPGYYLLMIIEAIEQVSDGVQHLVQDEGFIVLRNAIQRGHRKPGVAGESGQNQCAQSRENTRAEESGDKRDGRWGREDQRLL